METYKYEKGQHSNEITENDSQVAFELSTTTYVSHFDIS